MAASPPTTSGRCEWITMLCCSICLGHHSRNRPGVTSRFHIFKWAVERPYSSTWGGSLSKPSIFMVFLEPRQAHFRPVWYTFSRMLTLTVRPVLVSVLET